MRLRTSNPELVRVIKFLKRKANETGSPIWDDVAERLGRSRHGRVCANISRINRHTAEGETVVVPGKVLGAGVLDHVVHVAAFKFSKLAEEKIKRAKGECLTISELVDRNVTGAGVKIIG
ncbi:MAG: 50S ribosomal protein L18e [Candidatus Bathyarchaeia archaeon]